MATINSIIQQLKRLSGQEEEAQVLSGRDQFFVQRFPQGQAVGRSRGRVESRARSVDIDPLTGQERGSTVSEAQQYQEMLRNEALGLALDRAKEIRQFGFEGKEKPRLSQSKFGQGGFRPDINPDDKERTKVAAALQVLEGFGKGAAVQGPLKKRERGQKTEGIETLSGGQLSAIKKQLNSVADAFRSKNDPSVFTVNEDVVRQSQSDRLRKIIQDNPFLQENFSGPFGRQQLLEHLSSI